MELLLAELDLLNPKNYVMNSVFALNDCVPFRNTRMNVESLRRHAWNTCMEKASDYNTATFINALKGPAIVLQITKTPFLSEWFGISIGTIQCVVRKEALHRIHEHTIAELVRETLVYAKRNGMEFLSVSIPSFALKVSKVFESEGFYLSETFVNFSGGTKTKRPKTKARIKIRDMNKENAWKFQSAIERAYIGESFPNRFALEKRIGADRAMALYPNRFQEVFKTGVGKVMVATIKGEFAGAIIYAIDRDLQRSENITTNLQSGLGIIIPKKFRRMGVASRLIAQRQKRYKKAGAEYVSFGASINNHQMIKGLAALGLAMTSADLVFSRWVDQ